MYQWKYVLLCQEVKPLLTKPLLWRLLLLQIFFWHLVKNNIMQKKQLDDINSHHVNNHHVSYIWVYKWSTKSQANKNIPFQTTDSSNQACSKRTWRFFFNVERIPPLVKTLHHYLLFQSSRQDQIFLVDMTLHACLNKAIDHQVNYTYMFKYNEIINIPLFIHTILMHVFHSSNFSQAQS